jgi:hypothetical protein
MVSLVLIKKLARQNYTIFAKTNYGFRETVALVEKFALRGKLRKMIKECSAIGENAVKIPCPKL